MSEWKGWLRTLPVTGMLALYAVGLPAQNQVLEEVLVATQANGGAEATVLRMKFDEPPAAPDFTRLDATPAAGAFRACQKTGRGLYCLAGDNKVYRWASVDELAAPPATVTGSEVLDCRDPLLELDDKKVDTCTAMAANAAGTVIYVGGKAKGKAHNVIQAVLKDQAGNCPAVGSWVKPGNSPFCARSLITGRPLLVKLVRRDTANELWLLEERKTVLRYHDNATLTTSDDNLTLEASGKADWKLIGNEQLLSFDVVIWQGTPYALAATTKDRMLAVNTLDPVPSGLAVFNFATHRGSTGAQFCSSGEQHYDVTTGTESEFVFATDRNFCLVLALKPQANGAAFQLTAQETLSTNAGANNTFPPSLVDSSQGINLNLANCAGQQGCVVIPNPNPNAPKPAASLSNVQLVSAQSNMTLYQIVDIPDCRYIPDTCKPQFGDDLVAAGVIVDAFGLGGCDDPSGDCVNPAALQLNVTPLLPPEVTNALETPLPALLISRQYRAQFLSDFLFDAFLGITEQGVQFQGVFNGEFDVFALTGSELGCRLNLPAESPLYTGDPDNPPFGTAEWDLATTVSQNFLSGTMPPEHRDMLINTDCGSSRSSNNRWSLIPYNLEVTPCTVNPVSPDVWQSDGDCDIEVQGPTPDDAVFAKLLLSLYDDLGKALNEVACTDVDNDPSAAAPLTSSTCTTLNATFDNGKDKLDKCWDATQKPKQSAGAQNCQAFVSQLTSFSNTLALAPPNGPDPANRKGELQVRVEVLFHLYFERFEPSIPAAGFVEPLAP